MKNILPCWDSYLGPSALQSSALPTELQNHCYTSVWKWSTKRFQKPRCRPRASPGSSFISIHKFILLFLLPFQNPLIDEKLNSWASRSLWNLISLSCLKMIVLTQHTTPRKLENCKKRLEFEVQDRVLLHPIRNSASVERNSHLWSTRCGCWFL